MANAFMVTMPPLYTGGSSSVELDMQALARAIATELCGTVIVPEETMDRNFLGRIDLPGNLRMILNRVHGKGNQEKVEASVNVNDVVVRYDELPRGLKWPRATVSTGRPVSALAADLKRKVIEPAKPMAETVRLKAKEIAARKSALASAVDTFNATYPEAQAKLNPGGDEASVYYHPTTGGTGVYFSGRLYADGGVYFDRIGTINGDRADKVLRALMCE